MKRLLIPLLAALALPAAVNAESYWLVLHTGGRGKALEKIEMASMENCIAQGEIFLKGLQNYFYDFFKKEKSLFFSLLH